MRQLTALSEQRALTPSGGVRRGRRETSPPPPALAIVALLAWLVGYPLLMTLIEALGGPAWTLGYFAEFFSRPDEWLALWRSLWISPRRWSWRRWSACRSPSSSSAPTFPAAGPRARSSRCPVALPPLVGVIAFLFLYGESGFASRAVQALLGLERAAVAAGGAGGDPARARLLDVRLLLPLHARGPRRGSTPRCSRPRPRSAPAAGAPCSGVTLPLLRPALAGAALLTFMTSLASFSRALPLRRRLPGDDDADRRLAAQRRARPRAGGDGDAGAPGPRWRSGAHAARGRGRSPWHRRAGHRAGPPAPAEPAGRAALAGLFGWPLAALLLLPHAVLLLVSLVPAFTWTTEPFPPVLTSATTRALHRAGALRPIVNSLWMAAVATVAALALGLRRGALRRARAGGRAGRPARRRSSRCPGRCRAPSSPSPSPPPSAPTSRGSAASCSIGTP